MGRFVNGFIVGLAVGVIAGAVTVAAFTASWERNLREAQGPAQPLELEAADEGSGGGADRGRSTPGEAPESHGLAGAGAGTSVPPSDGGTAARVPRTPARARATPSERRRDPAVADGDRPDSSADPVEVALGSGLHLATPRAVTFDQVFFGDVVDTRTRDHVKSLLGELAWGRPAPLQEVPSGAARLILQCREAAAAHVGEGGDLSAATAAALLRSSSPGAAATAIGLADRGAFADVLAAAARDEALGAFRYAAVIAIAERCPEDARAAEAVIELTRTDDIDLRGLAEAALSRLGRRGQDEACDRLIAGDFHLADLVGFAPAAMASPRRIEVTSALRDPSAVLACCAALRGADFRSEELAPLAARLPSALDSVFTSAEGHDWVGFAADVLAGAQPSALVAIASSSRYPFHSRAEAFDRAFRHAGSPEASLEVAARVLASDELSRDVLGTVVLTLGDDSLTPRFTSLLRGLAARSRDPWAREEARRLLQHSLPRETGDLTIHAATWGAPGGKAIDVAEALRARAALGRLVEAAGNHLGGDPQQGTGKSLRIEYSAGSRRLVQVVPEGQAFHLP